MKQKLVPSGWLEREGRRLDCGPYLSGAMEAKVLLERLPVPRADLHSLTHGHEGGIYIGQRPPRTYVVDPGHGVPFLSSSTMLHADFTHADLLKKSDATSPQLAHLRIEEGTTLVSRSGTIGRMVYVRPEMSEMWASEHAIKIVPDPALVRPGYLHAFLSGRFGLPLVTGGTYGAVVQHIEPRHVARVPVPLAPDDIQEKAHRLVTEAAAMRTDASAQLRTIIREIEEAAGLPPIRCRSEEASPDTSRVKASVLGSRMDGLFHSNYHRSVLEPLLALPATRRTTAGELAERVFRPPVFKKITVEERHFGLPFFSTASILRSDPDPDAILSKRVKGIEDLIINELTVLVPADGQLNGIIGHPVLPIGDVVGGTVNNHAIRLFCSSDVSAGYLFACLSSEYSRRQLKARAYGSSVPAIGEAGYAGISGVVLPRLDAARMKALGRRAFAVRTARHDAIGREREARALVEHWIEAQGRA